MERHHGFKHFDMEASNDLSDELLTNFGGFIKQISSYPKVVISWGIPTWLPDIVEVLRVSGFKIIWLDGDRQVSQRLFIDRKARNHAAPSIEAFRERMKLLDETGFVQQINPILISSYTETGSIRESDELVKEILETT